MADKFVIIDGNSIFYRSFYALPLLVNNEGKYSNAVYGFAMQVINIINNIKPKYMAVAFDVSKKTFRNEIYSEYKATRKPMPDELRCQIEPLKEMLKLMKIKIVEKEGIEGDDIIGILSNYFLDTENIIVTGDRDTFQLVNENTSVYFTKRGTSDVDIITPKTLKNLYGVDQKQFIDLKALQGDKSDNIPGVAGIGPKTALELLQTYGSIDGVYENLDKIAESTKRKLQEGKADAYMSKELATILTEFQDLNVKLEECKFDYPFSVDVKAFFKKYDFKSLLKNENYFDNNKDNIIENQFKIVKVEEFEKMQNLAKIIKKERKFAYFFENYTIHIGVNEIEYLLSFSNDLFAGEMKIEKFFEIFKPIFESTEIQKICFDSKQDMYYLKNYGVELNSYFDCSIAKYLIGGFPVESVYDVFFDDSLSNIAVKLLIISEEFKIKIEAEKLHYLFYDVENKLSKVLFSMEEAGFKIDSEILNSLKEKYEIEQTELEGKIYELAGEKFNLNSAKQLAFILYEKLNLTHKKKQSTTADNLKLIEHEHEIVRYILRYRKVTKFLSTYVLGIMPHVDLKGLVHTYFKQTSTTTGRLASVEPNLQNIPIRSEESREIRSMFVASNDDRILIDADYSQIELRLLAHCSKDPIFIDAFNNNFDIHTMTASVIFGVNENFVTKEMRRTAKVVNFGIIYGISEYGLAEDLMISPREARGLIENYYYQHPFVKQFMEQTVANARQSGKVETIFGRKRNILDINSSNYTLRTRAERMCQNMPLQGSAADLIKIAMVSTFERLKREKCDAKLIMQIHDELIVDCSVKEKDRVVEILREEMESACKLSVPLVVDVQTSYRWSDGH